MTPGVPGGPDDWSLYKWVEEAATKDSEETGGSAGYDGVMQSQAPREFAVCLCWPTLGSATQIPTSAVTTSE